MKKKHINKHTTYIEIFEYFISVFNRSEEISKIILGPINSHTGQRISSTQVIKISFDQGDLMLKATQKGSSQEIRIFTKEYFKVISRVKDICLKHRIIFNLDA